MEVMAGTRRVLQQAAGVLCIFPGALAVAQQAAPPKGDLSSMELEQLMQLPVELVTGASRYEQRVTQAPASVSIVNADDIARFGYRTLAEVLNSVAGLHSTYDRNYTYMGFRGFSRPGDFNTRILLLVDGHRVNDVLYGLMYVGNEAVLDVDLIDRVEVIRGPASSIYGNSAIFGVINVITRRGRQIDGLETSAQTGSFDTYKGRLTYGTQTANGVEFTLSGSYYDSAGHRSLYFPEFDNPSTNNGLAVDVDRERASRVSGSLSFGEFTLAAAFSSRYKEPPTAPYDVVFDNSLMHTRDKRAYVDLKYQHAFSGEMLLIGRMSYDWYPYDADFPYQNDSPPPNPLINKDSANSRWGRGELQLTRKILDRHTLIVGAEYQDAVRLRQQNYNVDPFESFLDASGESHDYGLYTQGEFILSPSVLLNAGLRYDRFQSFGGTKNPRLGLIYSPRQSATVKLLYGRAFRAPSEYELNYQSRNQITNSELRPETIRTYEAVYEQYLGGHLRLSLAGYRYDIDDLISLLDIGGQQVFGNADHARAKGAELQLEARYANGLLARGSYTWQHSEDIGSGLELSNSPRNLGRLSVSVPLRGEALSGSLELQYNSPAISIDRNPVGGYALLNFTLLSRKLFGRVDASASVFNLLDKTYSTPSAHTGRQDVIEQDGRTVYARLTYTFQN